MNFVNEEMRKEKVISQCTPICTRTLQLIRRPDHGLEVYWTVDLWDDTKEERIGCKPFHIENNARELYWKIDSLYRTEDKTGIEEQVLELINTPSYYGRSNAPDAT